MGVLEAVTDDPQGQYVDKGMLYTGDDVQRGTDDKWAIDGHPFEHRGRLYIAWSGWEHDKDVQHLYLAEMSDPWTSRAGAYGSVTTTLVLGAGRRRPRQRGLHEARSSSGETGRCSSCIRAARRGSRLTSWGC